LESSSLYGSAELRKRGQAVGSQGGIINYLSIDVEDYFQVSAFESISPPTSWDARELRVETNTHKILDILDESQVKATFFVLGWVAERCPGLVRYIAARDHEIASHGYGHQRVYNQQREVFGDDVRRSKSLLEDISGHRVIGYRAPSYSISKESSWAFDELLEAGYRYDSSIFPIRHDFYGMSDWPRFAGWMVKNGSGEWAPSVGPQPQEHGLFEVPITTLQLGSKKLPIAGGGYFRLLPYQLTHWGLQRINRVDKQPFVFYLHPWEFDPEQPRMIGAKLKSRARHYLNLDKTGGRFKRLLSDFKFGPIASSLQSFQ
jgi:polysaccharide deacetylase family protein (PEP-CTERM system associated)